jgi:hypothetical protein
MTDVQRIDFPRRSVSDGRRKQVIQIEVDLPDHANARAAVSGERDDRLDTELEALAGPDDAGIDEGGRILAPAVLDRRLELELDERNQVSKEARPAEIADVRLQVGEAVFQREPVNERLCVLLDLAFQLSGVLVDVA